MSGVLAAPLCPICSGAGQPQPYHPEATLYRCADCGHCYTDPASIADPEDYGPEYFAEAHRNWFENPHTELFELIRSEIRDLGPQLSLLDIGCGKGDLLVHLHQREPEWQLTGLDLSDNAPVPGITLLKGDVFSFQPGRQYDVVVNLLVIEHIAEAHKFVAALKAQCRPGGRIVITTNDEAGLLYAAARTLRRLGFSGAYDRLYSRHHLNHFSVRSLRRLLESEGLTVLRTIHHNIPLTAVDLPPAGPAVTAVWRAGVAALFTAGLGLRRTFLQTVVCQP